jgi:hypothetical protein
LTQFVYAHTYAGQGYSDHWVMEMAIDVSYFGDDWQEGGIIHWTQACGNDAIDITVTPEPTSFSLLILGAAGLLGLKRKKGVK